MSQADRPTSIRASEQYLRQQPWWPAYERLRPPHSKLSDILFLGHFCFWLDERELRPEDCTTAELAAYRSTLSGFREDVRAGYLRAASDLVALMPTAAGAAATS